MNFIDTNVFIYAQDESDPVKSHKARKLISNLISANEVIISPQVIQEFCNAFINSAEIPLSITDLRKLITDLLAPITSFQTDDKFQLRALDMYERYSLSFYDAAIVQSANDLNCTILYSEDLQDGAIYGKVKVVNPFL